MVTNSTSVVSPPPRGLDIIVPIYKNAALLKICLDSLVRHIGEIAARSPRLVLINDSPGDEKVGHLLVEYARLGASVLINEENLGFVRSANRGLLDALHNRRDVLLVNSDTETFAGTLRELLKAAKSDPQIGFASPRSNNASICSLPHFFGGLPPERVETYARWREISRTMPSYHFAPTAVGFYMFISFDVLAEHGVLQEEFGLGYEEENDLVMRAGKSGTRAIIVNHSFAYHAGSASFDLTNLDLGAHKHKNLLKLAGHHPEFLPLVKRYETSARYKAERLMTGLLKDGRGRTKVAFDLRGMGQHFNGTNEQAVAVLRSMASRQSHRICLTGIASEESFRFHELDKIPALRREEPTSHGIHGIAVRMAQPFNVDDIGVLESLAPLNIFAMLDTIAEDCGPLAVDSGFLELWDHAAEHANGLIFTSRFTEQTFCNRHSIALNRPRWQSLLPTRLSNYARSGEPSKRAHVLVLGNHFAHKGTDVATRTLSAAFPDLKIVALGSETVQSANVTNYRSGLIERSFIDHLFWNASVVVLPSYVEGFGFGFMHALAASRPIVARRIPATEEILATLDEVRGVFLFDHTSELVQACRQALNTTISEATDVRGKSWDEWSDGLTDFCLSLALRDDVFTRLVDRLTAGDRLRRATAFDAIENQRRSVNDEKMIPTALSDAKAVDLQSLLALEGKAFVEHAYATLLCRPVDAAGLSAYSEQLEIGAHKLDLLQALSNSAEGRERDIRLIGLDEMVEKRKRSRLPWLSRIFAGQSHR